MFLNGLQRLEEDIWTCAQCGFCTACCPVAEQKGWESYGPRGKMYLLKSLLQKQIPISEEIKQRIYTCTTCSRCNQSCQTNLHLEEIWEEVRALLVEEQLGPMEVHKGLAASIGQNHNPFREPAVNRGSWANGFNVPDKGKVAYFAGCTASFKINQLARNTLRILQSMGKEVTLLGEKEWCCGSVLLRTGQREQIKEIVEHNIAALRATGAEMVVTSCTGCFKTVSTDYPAISGAALPFKMMHITQYLAEEIKLGNLKFTRRIAEKVTYHDPCHLGLHLGEYDAPRAILQAIPGLELIEMENVREKSRCCGAGGGMKAAHPELALNIAKRRVDEAVSTGASILASCCPFCKTNLSEAIKADNQPVVQKDITELVLTALGMEE